MPRIPLVDPATAPEGSKAIFEGPLKGKHLNIFKAMGNSPAVLNVYLGMAGSLAKASLSSKEQEAIQLAIGQANDCGYCLAAHTKIGMGAGLTEAQTLEARRGSMPSDAKLDALVKFARALHEKRGHVGDAEVEALRGAGYTDAQVAEAVASYALAHFTNVFNHVAATPIDFPEAKPI